MACYTSTVTTAGHVGYPSPLDLNIVLCVTCAWAGLTIIASGSTTVRIVSFINPNNPQPLPHKLAGPNSPSNPGLMSGLSGLSGLGLYMVLALKCKVIPRGTG